MWLGSAASAKLDQLHGFVDALQLGFVS